MTREGGSSEEHPDDPKHISEALGELLYDHLEPGKPVAPALNQFKAAEHLEELDEQKLAEASPEVPVKLSSDEVRRREELLLELERQRQEKLFRLKKEK